MNYHFLKRNRKKGFTFIELIVVIVIVALMFTMLVPSTILLIAKRKVVTTERNMDTLADAIVRFHENTEKLPTFFFAGSHRASASLVTFFLLTQPNRFFGFENWSGPYIKLNQVTGKPKQGESQFAADLRTNMARFDVFGNEYFMEVTGQDGNVASELTITSRGPNGQFNNGLVDDIVRVINVRKDKLDQTREEIDRLEKIIAEYNKLLIADIVSGGVSKMNALKETLNKQEFEDMLATFDDFGLLTGDEEDSLATDAWANSYSFNGFRVNSSFGN